MRAIKGITERKHLPIVVGGTGLYIKALVDNLSFPKVPPKPHLREAFEKVARGVGCVASEDGSNGWNG